MDTTAVSTPTTRRAPIETRDIEIADSRCSRYKIRMVRLTEESSHRSLDPNQRTVVGTELIAGANKLLL